MATADAVATSREIRIAEALTFLISAMRAFVNENVFARELRKFTKKMAVKAVEYDTQLDDSNFDMQYWNPSSTYHDLEGATNTLTVHTADELAFKEYFPSAAARLAHKIRVAHRKSRRVCPAIVQHYGHMVHLNHPEVLCTCSTSDGVTRRCT
jgi:hypothetical protein